MAHTLQPANGQQCAPMNPQPLASVQDDATEHVAAVLTRIKPQYLVRPQVPSFLKPSLLGVSSNSVFFLVCMACSRFMFVCGCGVQAVLLSDRD